MRYIVGVLLLFFCLPSGGAADRSTWLTGLAGVPIQLFDLRSANVSDSFRAFLSETPMMNDRPLPAALVDDTVASLSYLKAVTPPDQPSYFVAAYIQKTPYVSRADVHRLRYLERYGEHVYPQQACPVFISRGDAGVAGLLSTAVGLPPSYFSATPGMAQNFDRLFALTEASHCGFIARELVQPTVIPEGLDQRQLRIVMEALGDYEATEVFRSEPIVSPGADEADALFAARLLGMFLLDRENAYTPLPGLVYEYERIGIPAAHDDMERILASVRLARHTLRAALVDGGLTARPLPLGAVRRQLAQARSEGRLAVDDALATELIRVTDPALKLLEGQPVPRDFWRTPPAHGDERPLRLVTLSGAVAGY